MSLLCYSFFNKIVQFTSAAKRNALRRNMVDEICDGAGRGFTEETNSLSKTSKSDREGFAVIANMWTRQHYVWWKEQLAEYGEPGRSNGILWRRLKAFVAEEEEKERRAKTTNYSAHLKKSICRQKLYELKPGSLKSGKSSVKWKSSVFEIRWIQCVVMLTYDSSQYKSCQHGDKPVCSEGAGLYFVWWMLPHFCGYAESLTSLWTSDHGGKRRHGWVCYAAHRLSVFLSHQFKSFRIMFPPVVVFNKVQMAGYIF